MLSFDVAQPEIVRLILIIEVNGNDLLGDLLSERRDLLMFGMHRVYIKGSAVDKSCDQPGIERSLKMKNVRPDGKAVVWDG